MALLAREFTKTQSVSCRGPSGAGPPLVRMCNSSPQIVVGFLVDDLLSQYQVRLLMGLQRAARRHGVRLVSIPAGWFSESPPARFDGSFLFKLARPPVVQGVIVEASILATEVGVDAVQQFCRRLGLPVVSVSRLDGFPWVDSNTAAGLREAIEHLVFAHGRRRLCFIQGPPGNSHSREREQMFRAVLSEHGIAVEEGRILPGDFLENSGARAITTLLDERGIAISEIDGIVAANDLMAVGALDELTARGISVPRDVAIVGFDDDDLARNADPPITTVAQLVERIGGKAVELLVRLIAGETVQQANLVDVEVVVRRSCGCGESGSSLQAPATSHEHPREVVIAAAPACRHPLDVFFDDSIGAEGVDAAIGLVCGAEGEMRRRFRAGLENAIRIATNQGLDPLRWHDVIQPIEAALARHAHLDGTAQFESRFGAMKLFVSELAAQIKASEVLRGAKDASALRVLGSVLVSSRDVESFKRVLRAALPGMGVTFCCVCLFENEPNPAMKVHVAALVVSDGKLHPAPIQRASELWGTLYGNIALAPSDPPDVEAQVVDWPLSITDTVKGNLVVFPLVFAEKPLGYVVFSEPHQARDAWLLEGIAGHLSSAIHTMRNADRLRRACEIAEAANVAKGEFVAMMSHEIRTPLTAVLGQLDLSLRAEIPSEVRGRLELARSSSKSLLGIVNDLLDFSKMEAGRLEAEHVRFRIDEVLEQIVGASGIAAAQKGLELVVDIAPELPELLEGDPLRLSQILVNLVSNAVKFSFQGEVVVKIELGDVGPNDTCWLRFAVQDTGIGMSETERERLFEPFTQGDSSTTRRYGGTGLGLAISRRLVELLAGTLTVASEKGRGSRFAFELPFTVVRARRTLPSLESLRVLLAEDNPSQRNALARTLTSLGARVVEVDSLDGLGDALTDGNESYDLAVVDALLSGRDVDAVLETMAAAGAGVRCVMMSPMHRSLADGPIGTNLDRVEFVNKPLIPKRVFDIVRRIRGIVTPLPPPTFRGASVAATGSGLARRLVLLVQDNEVSREIFQQLLQQFGLVVRTALDGGQAVHEALSLQFDMILMDLHLPVLDGFAAARAIRMDPRYSSVPILALTASQTPGVRSRCIAAGMNDCLTTPMEPEDLETALEYWLGEAPRSSPGVSMPPPPPASPEFEAFPTTQRALDTGRGIQRVGGRKDDYRRVLTRFVDVHGRSAEVTAGVLRQGDIDSALTQLHALVSASGNIGATGLFQIAQTLERSLRNDPRRLPWALIAKYVQIAQQTNDEARAWLVTDIPVAGALPVTQENCARMLDEMAELLTQHDTVALTQIDALCACLKPKVGADLTGALKHLVRSYEFERASECLLEIRAALRDYLSM